MFSVFANGIYDSLSNLFDNMLIISSMRFMDPYNFDVERIQKCVVHNETPARALFCTMNALHRGSTEKRFDQPR